MCPGVDKPSQDFFSLFLYSFLISHLRSKILNLNENFLHINSGHKQHIRIILLQLDNLAQIILIHSLLDSNIRPLPKLRLLNLLNHEQVGIILMLELDDALDIDINQPLQSLTDGLFVLGLYEDFAGVLFLHGHSGGDLDLELVVFGLLIVLGFFEDGKDHLVLFAHLALD